MKKILILLILAIFARAQLTQAGSHTWSGAVSGHWNTAANWSSGGKPVPGESNVALFFPAVATRYVVTNNIVGLQLSTIAFNGDYVVHGSGGAALAFAGDNAGITVNGAHQNVIASSLPVVLDDPIQFHFSNAAGQLTVQSVISGPGGVTKNNAGTLTFAGTAPNTYAGPTIIKSGTLVLNKSAGFPATGRASVPGPLQIGTGAGSATVRLDYSHQLANDAPVLVNTNAVLDLNDKSEIIGPLTLNGNVVDSGPGLLTLNGDLTVNPNPAVATLAGRISLGSSTRTFHVAVHSVGGPPDLMVSATVSGAPGVGLVKEGFGELTLSSSNSYSGQTILNGGTLSVEHAFALGITDAGTVVNQAQLFVRKGARVGLEPLTINGSDTSPRLLGVEAGVTNSWAGSITITTNTTLYAYGNFILSGAIGGTGSVKVTTIGALVFAGNTPNTYSGPTLVEVGVLQLGKTDGVSVPGALIIGTTNVANPATVLFTSGDQIAATALVALQPSGVLDLHDCSNVIGALDLTGGLVRTGDGMLSVTGNVTTYPWTGSYSTIYGHLKLLGADGAQMFSTFDTLLLSAQVHGGPSSPFIKAGAGVLWLNYSNAYSGVTTVQSGSLVVNDDFALGADTAGTTVAGSGSIWISGNTHIEMEPLTFTGNAANALSGAGTSSWAGPISLQADTSISYPTNALLTLSGTISGPGELKKTGPGTLRFSGATANTHGGGTLVAAGTLQLQKSPGVVAVPGPLTIGDNAGGANADLVWLLNPEQIADDASVIVTDSGRLELDDHSETIGSVAGAGSIHLGAGQLTTGGKNLSTTLGGTISGSNLAALTKEGTGTMTLSGANTYPGPTTVNGGTLLINGSQPASAVTINTGGTLGGAGLTGPVTGPGGKVSPGNSPGLLSSGAIAFLPNSSFEVELNGLLPGTNYDQLNVTGGVNLGGATLSPSLGFASAVSNQFLIIKNDGADAVTGSFAGLPEGSAFVIGGTQFQISYVGGTGNDVVLTQLTIIAPPQLAGITRLGAGQMQLTGSGVPGGTYTVEANFDLGTTNWLHLGEITAQPPTGALQFIDVDAAQYPQRFYRFVAP